MTVTVVLAMPVAKAVDQGKREGVLAGFPAGGGSFGCRRSAPSTRRKFCRFGRGSPQLFEFSKHHLVRAKYPVAACAKLGVELSVACRLLSHVCILTRVSHCLPCSCRDPEHGQAETSAKLRKTPPKGNSIEPGATIASQIERKTCEGSKSCCCYLMAHFRILQSERNSVIAVFVVCD